MGRGYRFRENWANFAYWYCRNTESRLDYAFTLFLEFILILAFIDSLLVLIGESHGGRNAIVIATLIILIQAGYFRFIRFRPAYAFHLSDRAAGISDNDELNGLTERRMLFYDHVRTLMRIVEFESDGCHEQILSILLKEHNVANRDKLDFDGIFETIDLDFIYCASGLPNERIHEPFSSYNDSLVDAIPLDALTTKSLAEFLIGYYSGLPEAIRETAIDFQNGDSNSEIPRSTMSIVILTGKAITAILSMIYLSLQILEKID